MMGSISTPFSSIEPKQFLMKINSQEKIANEIEIDENLSEKIPEVPLK